MTGLSDAFKDVMTRGAVVDLTDDDFATITAPPKAGPWTRHSVALHGGSGKRAGILHTAISGLFWSGLAFGDIVLSAMNYLHPIAFFLLAAAVIFGLYGHVRLARVTCLRAAGYTYDWQTHTAHKIRPSGEVAAALSTTPPHSTST